MSEIKGEVLQPEGEVPFNLETLRRHLSQIVLARRVLAEDVAARQQMLEQSVYNVAVERMKHQADQMINLGLPSMGLQSNDLRSWMWQWHQKLQVRIQAEVEAMVVEERVMGRCLCSPSINQHTDRQFSPHEITSKDQGQKGREHA